MKKLMCLFALLLCTSPMFSQKIEAPEISTSVYVDAYYATDNDNSTGWGKTESIRLSITGKMFSV